MKVFTFVSWWDDKERRCSQVKQEKQGESKTPSKGTLHEYDTREEAEKAREEELSKNS